MAPVKKQGAKPSVGSSISGTDSLTASDIFNRCIARADNLVRIHADAHGTTGKPPAHLSDAHRAAIVMAISALDAYVRKHVATRVRELLADRTMELPGSLKEKILGFWKPDKLLEAARKDDILDRVDKALEADFDTRSFQGTKRIEEAMSLCGYDDIFGSVAGATDSNVEAMKSDLDAYTIRRHAIAHKGDYDTSSSPPKETPITKKDVTECITLVKRIVKGIEALESHQ